MFRNAKAEILRDLDPKNPASIQALIDFHRATFGGYTMMADPTGDAGKAADSGTGEQKPVAGDGKAAPTGDAKDAGKGDDKGGADTLGAGGLKALQAERDARQKIENEFKEFKTSQADQAKKIAEAFGIKTEDAKSEDAVAELQKQFQSMQHENLVYRIVTDPAHPISDKDDLELIKSAPDEATMRKLAARLAKKADDGEGDGGKKIRRFPGQDRTQGRGSGSDGRPTSVEQVRRDREAARAAKEQQRNTQ